MAQKDIEHKFEMYNNTFMEQPSLKRNTTLVFIKYIFEILCTVITFPYVSRILMPEGIGKINFSNSIVNYFTMLAGLGIDAYAIREGAKLRDNKEHLNKFASEVFLINIISTTISYIALFIFLIFANNLKDYRIFIITQSLVILFNTIGFGWIYTANENYNYIAIGSIISKFLYIILTFIFVKTQADTFKYLIIGVIISISYNLVGFINSLRYIKIKITKNLQLKKHIKPIFLFFQISIITTLYTVLDVSILGFLTDDTQVGLYSAATKINKIVLGLIVSIGTVVFPRSAYYVSLKETQKAYNLFNKSLALTICLAFPCIIGLNILGESIVLTIIGENYISAISTMKIMNPIIIIIAIALVIQNQFIIPYGKEKLLVLSRLLGAITNITLNFILIPKYKAEGAAIATIFAETSVTISQLIVARKFIFIRMQVLNTLQFILATIIMGISIFFLKKWIDNNILEIIICPILGVAIYFGLLVLFKNKIVLDIIQSFSRKIKSLVHR